MLTAKIADRRDPPASLATSSVKRANAPPAPQMSTGEWNPTQSRVGTVYRMERITRAEALETTPTVSRILFFEISAFSQENPRVGANPPVLSAAAKKSGTGARLQRRLVALEDVYRREGVAGEKRARGALGRRAPSEPAHRLVRTWVYNPAQLRAARWAHRARAGIRRRRR